MHLLSRRLCVPGHMDYSDCDGGRARTCARYATLSTTARYLSGQCAAHSVGLSHVRNNRDSAVFDLVQRSDCPQASAGSVASILCIVWDCVPAAMRYHVDHIVECAGHTFAMQTRRFPCGWLKVSKPIGPPSSISYIRFFKLQSNRRWGDRVAGIQSVYHLEWSGHVDTRCENVRRLHVQRAHSGTHHIELLHHWM